MSGQYGKGDICPYFAYSTHVPAPQSPLHTRRSTVGHGVCGTLASSSRQRQLRRRDRRSAATHQEAHRATQEAKAIAYMQYHEYRRKCEGDPPSMPRRGCECCRNACQPVATDDQRER